MNKADPSSLPVLLEDESRLDWPEASYKPEVSVRSNQATVTHHLKGATALRELIESGAAAWAVELRCPTTLMARVETSPTHRQVVSWLSEDVRDAVYIVPGLIALEPLSLDASALESLWADAGELRIPAGWWLAKGDACRSKTLTESLVTFRRDDGMMMGTMEANPDHGGGRLRFVVKMAPDVFERAKSDRTLQVAALVGVCGWFPRVFGTSALTDERSNDADDDASAGDYSPLARELSDRLMMRKQDVALWNEGTYDPALTATLLEPFRVADFEEENDDD